MKEIELKGKKHGMLVLIFTLLLLFAATAGAIYGGIMIENGGSPVICIVSIVLLCIGWLPLCGLRVLKPQEALVITLFGKYKLSLVNYSL